MVRVQRVYSPHICGTAVANHHCRIPGLWKFFYLQLFDLQQYCVQWASTPRALIQLHTSVEMNTAPASRGHVLCRMLIYVFDIRSGFAVAWLIWALLANATSSLHACRRGILNTYCSFSAIVLCFHLFRVVVRSSLLNVQPSSTIESSMALCLFLDGVS